MNPLMRQVRRLLVRRRIELRRITTPLHDLDEFMVAEAARQSTLPPLEIDVFDSEPRIQRLLLRSFRSPAVHFHGSPGAAGAPEAIRVPAGRSWVFLGGAWTHPAHRDALFPLAAAAECLLIRLDPANETAGDPGFPGAVAFAAQAGLALCDVISSLQPVPFNAAAHRILLLFRRPPAKEADRAAARRIDEARAFLSAPVATRADFRPLTGRGFLGFAAGVFNPGALEADGRLTLVFRGERLPWAVQEESEDAHLKSSAAVIGRLDETGALQDAAPLALVSDFDPVRTRTEDYRLFSYRGRCLCSHSLITPPAGRAATDGALRVEDLRTRVAISELHPARREMRLIAEPQADFPLHTTEKNWAFFASGEDLLVIYSVAPYRVLRSRDWPKLTFTSEITASIAFPFGTDGRPIRNSIHPVPYDEHHLLHVVHKVYPSKQYVFWALLIDRRTLLPAFALDRPLVRAGPSVSAAIVYACSVVVRPAEILVFAGVDDCESGYWRLDRKDLDARWRALPPSPATP